MSQQIPASRLVRLATLADLPRIGVVVVAGFHHSARQNPNVPFMIAPVNNVLAGYRMVYRRAILDPQSVVFVVEAVLDQNEVDAVHTRQAKSYPPLVDQLPPEGLKDGRAIVGVTSLTLQEGSARAGQFQTKGGLSTPKDAKPNSQDDNAEDAELISIATSTNAEKIFAGRMTIDTMVVHPAYWRQGHATAMARRIIELADDDQVGLGVEATDMGALFFQRLGFRRPRNPNGLPASKDDLDRPRLWLGIRDPVEPTQSQV